MRHRLVALIVMLLLAGSVAASDAATIISWNGANAFDDQTQVVTPFLADRLTSISGTGYSDNHGTLTVQFQLSIWLNGVLIPIDTWTQTAGHHLLSERTAGGPLTFQAGMVSGFQLSTNPDVHTGFNEMYKGNDRTDMPTRFTFERVPEPGALILLGSGFAALAALARRRRR